MDLIGLRNYSGKYYHHENFSYLIELCGSSLSVISDVTGIPLTHLSRFKNGTDEIRIFDLVMIKGLFGISIDDFLLVDLRNFAAINSKKYNPFDWAGCYRVNVYDNQHQQKKGDPDDKE